MAFNKGKYQAIIKDFTLDRDILQETAAAFRRDIECGLQDPADSSLRMLQSYVGLPDGNEQGSYLALDFGGSNVRVLRIELLGNGKFQVVKKVAKPLRVPGVYDFIGQGSTAVDMFDFIAGLVDEAIDEDHTTKYMLGHTFSFPSEQTDLYNARLILWTKEFATTGVEGEVVNDLLKAALQRQGIQNVEPSAIINDTVAVLLAAAYKQPDTRIGCIYATGYNTCYLEPSLPGGEAPMVINMESGGFCKLLPNRFDNLLDDLSERPGEQRLEKMVSGRYMGELFGLALQELMELPEKPAFTSIDMSAILEDAAGRQTSQLLQERTGCSAAADDCAMAKGLAEAIVIRSARLVTATYAGIIWHLAGEGKVAAQHIAVDGSVYEKMPLAKENIQKALYDLLGEDAAQVDTMLECGGSGLGAAIAAAMSQKG